MRRTVIGWVTAVALGAAGAAAAGPVERDLGGDVSVRLLAPGVWLHVSRGPTGGDGAPANGLLVTTGEMSLLIDTGWSAGQTERLLDWAEGTLGQPVGHVIVTHAHPDRAGGLSALAGRPVILQGHAGTQAVLRQAGGPELEWIVEFEERVEIGGETVDLYYPGPGHAPDNLVVQLPRRRLLFGGCLIRAASDGLGYTADARLADWSRAVRRVIERYREIERVVPGHGEPGGVELLSHTMELLERAAAKGAQSGSSAADRNGSDTSSR